VTKHPYGLMLAAWGVSLCLSPWIASPWLRPDWLLVAMALVLIREPRRVSLDLGVFAGCLAALTAIDHPLRAGSCYVAVSWVMMELAARFEMSQPKLQWVAIAGLILIAEMGAVVWVGSPTLMLLGVAGVKGVVTLLTYGALARWTAQSGIGMSG